jgi:hypothetical protein
MPLRVLAHNSSAEGGNEATVEPTPSVVPTDTLLTAQPARPAPIRNLPADHLPESSKHLPIESRAALALVSLD